MGRMDDEFSTRMTTGRLCVRILPMTGGPLLGVVTRGKLYSMPETVAIVQTIDGIEYSGTGLVYEAYYRILEGIP